MGPLPETRSYLIKRGQDLIFSESDLPDGHVFHAKCMALETRGVVYRWPVAVLHAQAASGRRITLDDGFAVVAALAHTPDATELLSLYLRRGDGLRATFPGCGPDTACAVRVSGHVIRPAARAAPAPAPPAALAGSVEKDEKKDKQEKENEEEGLLRLEKEAEEAYEEARTAAASSASAAAAAGAAGAPIV